MSYSAVIDGGAYKYRIVTISGDIWRAIFNAGLDGALLTETQWRSFGIQQSPGWEHFDHFKGDKYALIFRRPNVN